MTQTHDLTALEQGEAIRDRDLSPAEVPITTWIGSTPSARRVGAFFTVAADLAREQARKAERMVAEAAEPGGLPPLLGVPVPVKDLNMAAGIRLTYGSAVFADNVAATDDHVVGSLRAAGAVITGKTATPEFGLPCYTETKIGPPARAPWDLSRSAWGSSGGTCRCTGTPRACRSG